MMKKHLLNCICVVILNCFLATNCFSQHAVYKEDNRVLKYERDIIQYLVKEKSIDANVHFDAKDFDFKIDVEKCLEIYSDAPKLLIRFGVSGDHSPRFWGVLSDTEKYFFSDPDDIKESDDALVFEKKCDSLTVSIVKYYCYKYPHEDLGFVPRTSWIYHQNLAIIKDALHNKPRLTVAKVDSTVIFLISITGIKPVSNKDADGNYLLTQEDYSKWLFWYKKNGSRLYWDDKEKKLKIR